MLARREHQLIMPGVQIACRKGHCSVPCWVLIWPLGQQRHICQQRSANGLNDLDWLKHYYSSFRQPKQQCRNDQRRASHK